MHLTRVYRFRCEGRSLVAALRFVSEELVRSGHALCVSTTHT